MRHVGCVRVNEGERDGCLERGRERKRLGKMGVGGSAGADAKLVYKVKIDH